MTTQPHTSIYSGDHEVWFSHSKHNLLKAVTLGYRGVRNSPSSFIIYYYTLDKGQANDLLVAPACIKIWCFIIGTWISANTTGSPLTQMLIYCLHYGCPERIDGRMVKHLIDCIPEDKLWEQNGDARRSNFDRTLALGCPIELAIQNQRIDIAKQLVQAGADPICAVHDEAEQIIPLFIEFFEFGTNRYMSWLLNEHLSQDEVPGFIETVLDKRAMIFSDFAKKEFQYGAGRHHVHAVLTCGHEEMIKKFIEHFPKSENGQEMLKVKDISERTALQIAAANGDLESVSALLNM